MNFSVGDNCYVKDKFIGTTVAKKIEVNILNPNNEINLEDKEISVETGIVINGIEEKVPFGNFIIEKPDNEEVKEKTSFTGYDYMIKFNVLYKHRVTCPCKASTLFQDLCNQVGLEAGSVDFANADYMILGNPFTNNEDSKTVLSNIAQLAGGFAKIGRDNKVYIKTLKNISNLLTVKYANKMTVKELNLTMVKVLSGQRDNADEKLDGSNYFEDFSKNEQWGELNSLVIGISSIEGENTALDDKDSIKQNGLTEIKIVNNYFLKDQVEREKVIVPIWNNLKGLKYLPFKTQYYGYPYLECGDMIYIEDTKGKGFISYVFNHKFTFNGGFSGEIEAPAVTKTQTAYKNTFNLKTKFRKAERIIDKINGVIKDIIEENKETSNKLSEHTQTINSMKDTLKSQEMKMETVESKANNAQSSANEANTNAQNAQATANANTTKIETNTTKITEVEKTVDGITQTVSKTYATKTETENAKTDAINSANSATDDKLKNYSTTQQMNSQIKQTAEEINTEVSKKVGEDELCSKISQSAEEISLKGNRVLIDSTKFKLDKDGKMRCDEAEITGGLLRLYGDENTAKFFIYDNFDSNKLTYMRPNWLQMFGANGSSAIIQTDDFSIMSTSTGGHKATIGTDSADARIELTDGMNTTNISQVGIKTNRVQIGDEGYVMHGMNIKHEYKCNWADQLDFYVDVTYVGALSDKRLKTDIKQIDEKFLKAISELEIKQFKVKNRNGLISFGIIAQELIEVFNKYNINPKDYEILQEVQYDLTDNTMYYKIEYTQFLVLKQLATDRKMKQKDEMIQDLLKRVKALEGGK